LGELWNSQSTVLLRSTRCEWSKAWNEEVETWEGNHVDSELAEIRVQLTWESEASGNTAHGGRDEVVQVTISWGGKLECTEANIVKSLVVNAISLISVLNQLMNRESSIVWLNNGIRDLWRWDD
jgi:hypothetical protein